MFDISVIARRVASWGLQEQFASLSGDRNPIHMDELAARRTQAGLPVVHGVHTLLWALDCLVACGAMASPPVQVKAKFVKWVYLGDEAVLIVPVGVTGSPQSLRVEVLGMPVLTAELSYSNDAAAESKTLLLPSPAVPLAMPVERTFAGLEECSGNAYTMAAEDTWTLFGNLAALLTGTTVAEMAACSYVVGMEIPGLNSMFSRLDLKLRPADEPISVRTGLQYRVSFHDERFRKARVAVTGRGVSGTLEVFFRQPPAVQASMEVTARYVGTSEFTGMRALIVGGSRGLGEVTAKLIAAGGGRVLITYARGRTDAERVLNEIHQSGGGAEILQYDVRERPEIQLAGLKGEITHLFYFATNPIFRPKGDLVSPPILLDFVMFYLQGFYDLCLEMTRKGRPWVPEGCKLKIYYPSSIAVEKRPAGMTEYAMVKAAGEQMCRDMNQYLPALRILFTRLPRLRTDQTASVSPERELDPISVILPIIRELWD